MNLMCTLKDDCNFPNVHVSILCNTHIFCLVYSTHQAQASFSHKRNAVVGKMLQKIAWKEWVMGQSLVRVAEKAGAMAVVLTLSVI